MTSFSPDSSLADRVEPSPNFDERTGLGRPDMILLHYTGMQFAREAINRLCDPVARVSSHYVVLETGSIVQLVQEAKRAWHAGVSVWGGDPDVNSRSIGIEICNPGHDFGYPDFPSRQIAATITLCRSILTRHVIRPENIVAHSDVAPSRKNDPGEKFPWKLLAQSKIGLWAEAGPIPPTEPLKRDDTGAKVTELQKMLGDYGYRVPAPFPSRIGRRHCRRRHGADLAKAFIGPRWPGGKPGRSEGARTQVSRAQDRGAQQRGTAERRFQKSRFRRPRIQESRGRELLVQEFLARLLTRSAAHPIPTASVGWTAAPAITERWPGRKVRAPGQTVPDNIRRGRPQGKCHREQTAATR
jgi:N-acetylmuramoyl-L-alanine amidase